MTTEETVLADIKNTLKNLTHEQQGRVYLYRENLRESIAADPLVRFAIALVGAEAACE